MCKPKRPGIPWGSLSKIAALCVVGALPTQAAAQATIQDVRVGRHPGYARIVLDVSGGAVAAYLANEPAQLHIEAEPPDLDPGLRRALASLGVRLEPSARGALLTMDPATAGTWTAFRLGADSPRIVVDLGSGAPGIPPDAEPLPVRSALIAEPARSRPAPDTAENRLPRDPTPRTEPGIRVQLSGVSFVGLPVNGPTRDELMEVELFVRQAPSGDWRAAPDAPDARGVSLRELASAGPEPRILEGSVLQHMVERIAAVYAERGRFGTRVDIRQDDLDPLIGQRGRLAVHITEPDEIPD